MKPIHRRILELNRETSARFVEAEAARIRHLAAHPTRLAAIKCMDGRVLFPSLTKTPLGLVRPFRAIGGRLEVWWPSFLGRLRAWVEEAMSAGHRAIVFVTYHFSESDPHLGCAGWSYDTEAARAHADRLAADVRYVFGEQLDAIVAGIETDRDVLTLHGPCGDVSGAQLAGRSETEIRASIMTAFPRLDERSTNDLVPLLEGNARRVAELASAPRDLRGKEHGERILALGQGFDWLYEANLALIVNDADPDLAHSIGIAASILAKNLAHAAAGDEATILASVPYHAPGIDQRQAIARALGLRDLALRVVGEREPALLAGGSLHALAGVLWAPAKRFEPLFDEPRTPAASRAADPRLTR